MYLFYIFTPQFHQFMFFCVKIIWTSLLSWRASLLSMQSCLQLLFISFINDCVKLSTKDFQVLVVFTSNQFPPLQYFSLLIQHIYFFILIFTNTIHTEHLYFEHLCFHKMVGRKGVKRFSNNRIEENRYNVCLLGDKRYYLC